MLDFSRKFVCEDREYSTLYRHVQAPLFRKSFHLKKKPDSAEIVITGLGFYQLFINGTDITKGFLAPYVSNTDDIVYYDRYDLTDRLTEGENVIAVTLGDGLQNEIPHVWGFDKAIYRSSPKLAFTFEAKTGEKSLTFEADETVCTKGPVTFNNYRLGVHYDARLEIDGWKEKGFDDSAWHAPLAADKPRGYAKICEAEPLVVRSEISPVSFRKGEMDPYICRGDVEEAFPAPGVEAEISTTGGYLYDFGKNSAGIFRLKIKNTTPGQKISFQCGEILSKEGRLNYSNIRFFPRGYCQRDIYICRGAEEEIFVPPFIYHGFRYLYVHGIREDQATGDLLTYIEMNSDLKKRAEFQCSDEVSNRLYEMCDNSDLSCFHYFPEDCPHREKNGWTGDAAGSAEHMIMTLSVENSLREWMNNMREAQDTEGHIPGIIPTAGWGFEWGNGPVWDRAIFEIPYQVYVYRGETDMITENAHMMFRYLELLTRVRDRHGLIHWGLGDWNPIDRPGADSYTVPIEFMNGAVVVDICRKAAVMFDAVGLSLQADFAKKLGAQMREAVRKRYIDFSSMTVQGCSQTGQSMAVYYNLFDEAEKKQAVEVLVEQIHRNDDHMSFGCLGARTLFHVLTSFGYSDLAYKMITRKDHPSYGELVEQGYTTLPEVFFRDYYAQCGSRNHHYYGDIKHWFLRTIVGINVNPWLDDPDEIVIKPHFIQSLNFAEGSYDTKSGKIRVRWERKNDKIFLTVKTEGKAHFSVNLENGYAFPQSMQCFLADAQSLEQAEIRHMAV